MLTLSLAIAAVSALRALQGKPAPSRQTKVDVVGVLSS
jgi:hypothetical protein